jgi:small subunit ribosomal protein S9
MTSAKTEKSEKPEKKAAKKPAAKSAAKTAAPKKRAVAPKAKVADKAPAVKPEAVKVQPEVQANVVVTKALGDQNFYAVGKRKSAVAQVIISAGNGKITVNELPFDSYFGTPHLQGIVMQAMTSVGVDKSMNIRGKVHGGGINAQAESMRHAIARAIVTFDPESRRTLKKLGFLTRDSRVKERKKPGLKRARRAPQFSKR